MGREIRQVPPDWNHPENEYCPHLNGLDWTHKRHNSPDDYQYGKCFIPLLDQDYESARDDWLDGLESWQNGSHPDLGDGEDIRKSNDYWDLHGNPPCRESYRPIWTVEEATHFQIYETVSEGTPMSPVFATKDAMKQWLIAQGYSEFAASKFIEDEWAPSAMGIVVKGLLPEIHGLNFLPKE